MSYKLVDSDQLDADLTAVADAIRGKAGVTEELAFPDGFMSAAVNLVNKGDYLAEIASRTVSELVSDSVTALPVDFQRGNQNLHTVDLPNCTKMETSVFLECPKLKNVHLPKLASLGGGSLRKIPALEQIYLPELTTITGWGYVFYECENLRRAYFPKLTHIPGGFMGGCTKLTTLVLGATSVCALEATGAFGLTQIEWGAGYVYVPRDLVDSYKTATNWSEYANQIRAIEDYPEVLEGWE